MSKTQKIKKMDRLIRRYGKDAPLEIQRQIIKLFVDVFGDDRAIMKRMEDNGVLCSAACEIGPNGEITLTDQKEAAALDAFLNRDKNVQ